MSLRHTDRGASRGFSLIEVMVALIVLSVGLLGIARMQTLALSSTSVASQRSMAAIEAESLAGAMHANRGYWAQTDPSNATILVQGNAASVSAGAPLLSAAIGAAASCLAASCTPAGLAAFDLRQWAVDMNGVLPGNNSRIQCGTVTPVTCMITVTWAESAGSVNSTQATVQANNGATKAIVQNSVYQLYVQP
ncbi:MAG TPA: type IV pilus modification protein PilV [Steroidobacteraceae bacterium]|nr:type IV pilus modification protein PilV [Steroidobacteraceae bacterium]